MRILQVFNQYLEPGGEEVWVNQILRLASGNFEMLDLRFQSRAWLGQGAPSKFRQALLVGNNKASRERLRHALDEFGSDAVLFHNLIPVASLALYEEVASLGMPMMQYIHNFRPFSPSGTLWVGGRINESALHGNLWPEILTGAWEGSCIKTLLLAYHLTRLRRMGTLDRIARWIAVSDFMRNKFIEAGVPAERVVTLRHCWQARPDEGTSKDGNHYLFLGRLVAEKGIYTLLEAWRILSKRLGKATPRLIVAGNGPEQARVCKIVANQPKVEWMGYVSGVEKEDLLRNCRALLAPSIWWEPLGLIVYEAYDFGRPVIAAASGGLTETVRDRVTGFLHVPGDPESLADAVEKMEAANFSGRAVMGEAGRRWLLDVANPERWQTEFKKIANDAIAGV